MPQATATSIAQRIVALRRHGWTGIHIDVAVGVSPATLRRAAPALMPLLPPTEAPAPLTCH
ncbi:MULTISPECIES: hypothetical protein [Mesorhizobium]|uniref:hypothetical protein n=1 Tax=Mesorhizobium australicum TaxID=536018 RepID=UPI003EB9BDEC